MTVKALPPPVSTPKPKRRSYIGQLFFIRRRPYLRGIPLDWDRPDDEAYEKLIHDEGFISIKHWKDDDLSSFPVVSRDIKDLNEYLLPSFFQFSQKSRYYQNRFYLYQWVFVWGAFLTTVFGALAALYYNQPGSNPTIALNENQRVLSYITAGIGALTAFTTALANRGEPQKRWGRTRRLAEELRMHYFNYLSHLAPYDHPDRVQLLRENVINIRVKEQENV